MHGDDTGDNISDRNEMFGEFTAWYWAWKNIKIIYPNIEYIGMAHYRRFFKLDVDYDKRIYIKQLNIPKMENYEELIQKKLEDNDIILVNPVPFTRSIKKQYSDCHYGSDLRCMKDIIHELCPEYDESFVNYIENNSIFIGLCLFIARYELFDKYFEWLFPILFEAEKRIDVSNYEPYQKRVLAFLAERLLGVYVYHHKLKAVYFPIYYIDLLKNKFKYLTRRLIKWILPYGLVRAIQIIEIRK
jgi:hypothetical protein